MDFRGDDRAQALQVGAILLFGFLILGLSLYQATIVPDQNRGVEFNAYQDAASDLTELRNDVIAAASKDTTTGTNVRTGAAYPSRSVFINPPPPIGELRTTEPRNVTLENVTAVDGESANTELFVENALAGRNYSTRDVRFTPDYNVFDGQPMVVTGQGAYRYTTDDGGQFLPMTGQTLLQGDQLNLVFIDGDLSAQGSTTTVTTEPVSASTRTVTITGDGSDITLRLGTPPGITAETWVNRTGERLNASNPRVLDVEPEGNRIRIVLDGSKTYKLKLAKVEVREENDVSVVGDTTAEYVVTDSPATQTIQRGSRTELTVEVRDEFNNPVAGEQVTFTRDRGEFVLDDGTRTNTTTVTTNSEGKATVVYSATNGDDAIEAGSVTVDASIGGASYQTATFDIGVTDSGGGSSLNFGNLQVLSGVPGGPDSGDTGVVLDIRNSGTENINITAISINKTDHGAVRLAEANGDGGRWKREVFINVNDTDPDTKDSDDGYYEDPDNELPFGTKAELSSGAGENATVGAGESGTIYLFEFEGTDQKGEDIKALSMDGHYLKLTIYYEVGGEQKSLTTTVFVF
ncbi:hypothetical protein [Haloparvum sp. AD34]